ncbi:MAG TPA: hypothetical protein VK203_12700, partial [Nostocaceae cyanobacterium]|nr:hypothetical protein [Nostocaceae cyanobacterium]
TIARVDGLTPTINKIPAQTINQLKPEIPPLVEEAVCNSANGGCLSGALNQNANNINAATNASNNALFDKLNALLNGLGLGADAASMGLLNTINDKLGEQLPDGGIAGKLKRGFKWLHIDRVVNLVTLWSSLHNTIMLSDNISQTFFSILDNIIAIPQLIFNPEGETINSREVFGSTIEGWMKNLLGVEEWEALKKQWATWNRIYQSSANVVDNVRNIGSNISDSVEIVGRWTAQLGNGLQDEGLIGEDNWSYKPDDPKIKSGFFGRLDKFNGKLEDLDNALNSIQQVTQNIRDIAETANQIKTDSAEIKELVEKSISDATGERAKEIEAIPADTFTFNWEDLI